MSKKDKIQISQIRQKIFSLNKAMNLLVDKLVKANAIVKGTICEKRRKCGKAKCRCAKGVLHSTKILSCSHKGRSRILHLSKYSLLEISRLESQVREYQQFRRSRAKIVYYFTLLIKEINRMEHTISIEAAPAEKGGENYSEEKKD